MAFVRYSVMSPKTGEAERLKGLIEQLIDYHREQAGFVTEFLIEPDEHDLHAFMGRFAVWESEDAANAVASMEHDIALQSQIKRFADDEQHEERAFTAVQFFPSSGG